jgi:hypothetical protein
MLSAFSKTGLDVLVVLAIAAPSFVNATSVVPIAAVLLSKGLTPGAILVALVVGPALNVTTFGWLARTYGRRGAIGAVLASTAVVLAMAELTNLFSLAPVVPATLEAPGAGSWVALVALAILALGTSYRRGVRGFFAPVLVPVEGVGTARNDESDAEEGHGGHDGCDQDDPFHAHSHDPSTTGPTSVRLSAHGH